MLNIEEALSVLRTFPAPTVYEAAGKQGDMAPSIRPVTSGRGGPGRSLAGVAYTVKTVPGDALGVLKAISQAPRGSVLVVDAGGTDRSTIWGGTTTLAALGRGLAGLVTNGAVRDVDELQELGFPVFAAGVSVRGTVKSHPGWAGLPVSVGGVVVRPGDIVIGDSDGVVVVSAERAAEVAILAREQRNLEIAREDRLRAGEDLLDVLQLR